MQAFCWVITIIASILAAFVLIGTVVGSSGAPQEAAGAAISAAIVIIPYVFTKAVEGLTNRAEEQSERIIEMLRKKDVIEEKAAKYDAMSR